MPLKIENRLCRQIGPNTFMSVKVTHVSYKKPDLYMLKQVNYYSNLLTKLYLETIWSLPPYMRSITLMHKCNTSQYNKESILGPLNTESGGWTIVWLSVSMLSSFCFLNPTSNRNHFISTNKNVSYLNSTKRECSACSCTRKYGYNTYP